MVTAGLHRILKGPDNLVYIVWNFLLPKQQKIDQWSERGQEMQEINQEAVAVQQKWQELKLKLCREDGMEVVDAKGSGTW